MKQETLKTIDERCLPYKNTLLCCGVVALLTTSVHTGFMLFFLVPASLIYIPKGLLVYWGSPEKRALQLRKLIIWAAVISSIICLHWYYAYITRRHADDIVASINQFYQVHHRYPKTLDEIGLSPDQLKERLGMSGYKGDPQGNPSFFYASTFIVFDTFSYDFDRKIWRHRVS